ncbi:MAG: basic secretory protein-like protein [Nocardioides sp.]|uniref:basic secretory protein-like protein n=1 Tax=Nocardioides sp. TaxID=35761 RepID=UPI0039E37AA9
MREQTQVTVRRSGGVVVIRAAGAPNAAVGYLRAARQAVRTVAGVLPRWRPHLVVEVPADRATYAAAIDGNVGERKELAAVTTQVRASAPARVVLNPEVFPGMGRDGVRVVLAHEATHVATHASASDLPIWLVEGFADYVALRDMRVSMSRSAEQLIAWTRQHGPVDRLPGERWFAASGLRLEAAYEASWLACVAIADDRGEAGLVAFYRRAERSGRVEPPRGLVDEVNALVAMLE